MHSFKYLNTLGAQREPFLLISDFEAKNIQVILLKDIQKEDIEFNIDDNYTYQAHHSSLKIQAIPFDVYKTKFDKIIEKIKSGETYLTNLTQATPIQTPLSLREIYKRSNATFKLRYKKKFVTFSPERFIQIQKNTIHTYPMKGTIDASVANAKKKILEDEKEMAEHVMIVDLLRNDLSIVAKDVVVEQFRFVQEIAAGSKKLLQVSSHIRGTLASNWHENIGDILNALLPAGSISGTPKKSTVEIIKNVEGYERGFFSGIFGVFDGDTFDSGVMIRFIEKQNEQFFYKSGGGITLDSDVNLEYNELLDKIYLP